MVEPASLQTTISWRVACWISKATRAQVFVSRHLSGLACGRHCIERCALSDIDSTSPTAEFVIQGIN